ncbi:phage minor head protein [Tsukamurella pseudospumae]|nr:phage minor head protein [Tsukamurella pseudospumae]
MDLWRTAVYAAITEQQPNREQILAGGFFQHLWRLDSAAAAARTWLRWVDGAVAPSISAVFGEAFNTVRKTATVSPQPYEAAHMADVHDRLVIWPDGAFEELRPELQEALSEAESIGQVQDRVGAVLGIDKQTREHRARINEINRILDDPDADPADRAELLTQKAQLWRDHDESLQDWEWKARRIARTECLPADTPIEGGNITAVYRRHYEGEWIEVETCSGRKIAGTPNHPVLTIDGWKGLGELTEADRLVCHSISVEKACAAGDEHVQDTPPTIGQIFDAVAAVVVPEREATAEPDFHGDGRDGYVDVLRPDWLLRVGRFSALTEGGFDSDLAPSDHRAVAAAAERHSFSRDVPVPYGVSLLEVPDWDARAVQSGCDGSLVDPVARGERLLRYAGHVQADEFFVVEAESIIGETARGELPGLGHAANGNPALTKNVVDGRLVAPNLSGDAGRTPAGRVELDDVVRVHVGRFDGHVYNLTAVEGYFAGPQGIVTSNTQGAVEAGQYEAARASESQLGITLYKRWLATPDTRTRHSHWLADGQVVKLAERFTVGIAQLLYPADPSSGVASEVISCRCSLIYQEMDEVQAELQGPDGSIGEVVPQGVRLGPDDPAVVDAKIAELEAADDEHTDTRAEDWAPPLSAPTPESKLHVDNNAHPHGLPKWPEEERARRQLAAVPDFFPGEPLYQHEIEFVERFKARGETMQWIPKAQWDPITRNTPSTSDFLWRNNFSLPTEVKSTRAKYRSIRNAIQRAVETSIANPESPRKENFIIDIGHAQLNEVLRNQVGNYNRRNPGLQINRLWIMHSDGAGFDEIHQT